MKTVILGNSGSGKTWLAEQIAMATPSAIVHLDDIFWEPGGFDKKRSSDEVQLLVRKSKGQENWIVEGVFGDLAQLYVDDADCLIWLDIDWPVCKARLERRGSESKRHLDRLQSEEGLTKLIEWARDYYSRSDLRSRAGHKTLFDKFDKKRMHFTTDVEVTAYLRDIPDCAGTSTRLNTLIRPATKKDAVAICNVMRRSIAECCVEDHRNDPTLLDAWLRNKTAENVVAWITSPDSFSIVSDRDGEIQGFGLMSHSGEIRMCYVAPEVRCTGVGKSLLWTMESEARRLAIDELHLDSTSTGLPFYRRNGFEQKGEPWLFLGIMAYPCAKRISASALRHSSL